MVSGGLPKCVNASSSKTIKTIGYSSFLEAPQNVEIRLPKKLLKTISYSMIPSAASNY